MYELYLLDKPQDKLWKFVSEYINSGVGIAIPTYCLDGQISYNLSTSKSSVGGFSQHALNLPGGIRTFCPIHNHLFFKEEDIVPSSLDFYKSFGENTDFDFLLNKNYKILLFAVDFAQACTYIHNLEYLANVPYRKMIKFNRQIITNQYDKGMQIEFSYYARKDDSINTNFNNVIPFLENCSTFRKSKLSLFNSYAISINELHGTIIKLLKDEPTILLR